MDETESFLEGLPINWKRQRDDNKELLAKLLGRDWRLEVSKAVELGLIRYHRFLEYRVYAISEPWTFAARLLRGERPVEWEEEEISRFCDLCAKAFKPNSKQWFIAVRKAFEAVERVSRVKVHHSTAMRLEGKVGTGPNL